MKTKLLYGIFAMVLFCESACKKCYECTCTNPQSDPLFGCTVEGSTVELCERNSVTGRAMLSTRVLIKETEGYTCTVK